MKIQGKNTIHTAPQECAAAIDAYLEYRKRNGGERLTPESPLFRENFDKMAAIVAGFDNYSNDNSSNSDNAREEISSSVVILKKPPKRLGTRGVDAVMSSLLLKAGLTTTVSCKKLNSTGGGGTIRKVVKRSHGMRKFLLTALTEVGIDPQYRKILLGQDLGLDEHYLKPTEEQVLQQYTKAIDYITINNEHRLQKQIVELTEKQSDIEIMKLEQKQKDTRLEELEKNLQEQLIAQHKQQALLEALWQQQQISQQAKGKYDDEDEDNESKSLNIQSKVKPEI